SLVLVCGLIDVVVAFRLEKEVAGLASCHGYEPAHQGRHDGIDEDQGVSGEKTQRAHEVQALVDATVVIIAVIIPALSAQCLQEITHHLVPQKIVREARSHGLPVTALKRFDVEYVTSST